MEKIFYRSNYIVLSR